MNSGINAMTLSGPETLEITIPLPDPCLSPNGRCHHMKKARKTEKYRFDCGLAAKDAMNRSRINSFPWKEARVTTVFYHRVRRGRDRDNGTSSLKAAYDSLADAGIIVNDNGLHTEKPTFEIDRADARVMLTLERIR